MIFRPDLRLDEMVKFTLIAISDPDRGDEEIASQLWKSQFDHVEYVAVEGFKFDDMSEEEVQVEVDKIVSYLYGRLRSHSDDFLRFARVSAEDLNANLDDVDQVRGVVVAGVTAADDLKAKLQKEIEDEEGVRMFPKLVAAVFSVVEGGLEDAKLVEDVFLQLLDALLLQEDLGTVNQIVLKLRAMETGPNGDAIVRLRETFTARMGEEQRLTRIGEILRTGRPKSPQDLARYLQALSPDAVPLLLGALETVELAENRALVCDVLVPFAKKLPDPFVNRLGSEHAQTVRDMVNVLERAQIPGRTKMFAQALKHKNLAVRLEVMNAIAKGGAIEGRKIMSECLHDGHPQVRALAARLLPDFDRDQGFKELSAIVRSKDFEKKSPEEKGAFISGLGSTGVPAAITLLTEMLSIKPNLLNKRRVMEDKMLAVQGLGAAATVQTYKLLQDVVEERSHPPELLAAARRAMYQMRKSLFGDQAPPGDG